MSNYHLLYLEKNMYKTINSIDLQINLRQGFQIKLLKLLDVVALELVLYTFIFDMKLCKVNHSNHVKINFKQRLQMQLFIFFFALENVNMYLIL